MSGYYHHQYHHQPLQQHQLHHYENVGAIESMSVIGRRLPGSATLLASHHGNKPMYREYVHHHSIAAPTYPTQPTLIEYPGASSPPFHLEKHQHFLAATAAPHPHLYSGPYYGGGGLAHLTHSSALLATSHLHHPAPHSAAMYMPAQQGYPCCHRPVT